jgi:hypothetical protein
VMRHPFFMGIDWTDPDTMRLPYVPLEPESTSPARFRMRASAITVCPSSSCNCNYNHLCDCLLLFHHR